MADPFALNDDGTARDPAAFRKALREDPVKMEALEREPEVAAIVLGEDENAFQELIKSVYQVSRGLWLRCTAPELLDRPPPAQAAGRRLATLPPPCQGPAESSPCSKLGR